MNVMRASQNVKQRGFGSRGFTVTELLVVITIIAALVAVIVVALQGVRASAIRTESVNVLRQMVAGYNSYIADNRQRLMPGYIDAELVHEMRFNVRFEDGTRLLANFNDPANPAYADVGPYVWRLAPYVNHSWRTFFTDYRSAPLVSSFVEDFNSEIYGPGSANGSPQSTIAMMPSYGLNSIFLGGDTRHGGSAAVSYNPLTGTSTPNDDRGWAATGLSEVRNPTNLIVFAPTGRAVPGTPSGDEEDIYVLSPRFGLEAGYFELRPPFTDRAGGTWSNQQWRIRSRQATGGSDNGGARRVLGELERTGCGEYGSSASGYGAGLPIARWGMRHYPIANLDGSAGTVDINEIALDMRRWSPFSVGTEIPGFTPCMD